MQVKSLFDVEQAEGSVFVDNLMICSADRLLSTCYRHLEADKYLEKSEVAPTLFSHDLLNLSALVESVVCHDAIFVNSEYVDRWDPDVEQNTLRPLSNVITPISWPENQRKEAEDSLRSSLHSIRTDPGLFDFASVIFRDAHNAFRYSKGTIERDLFIPYDEGGRPWGTPFYIAMGTAFYLLSSQALGVPYKPSVIRAELLSDLLGKEYRARHFNAAEIAFSLMENSRDAVAKEYFDKILELNLIDINFPCVLSAVLKESNSSSDVIKVAVQIRDSKITRAFRKWSREFTKVVQDGDLVRIGEYLKEIKEVISETNKFLGLKSDDSLSVKLGWGPASLSHSFSLPKLLNKPIYFKRHLWFLHNMYRGMISMARISDHIERVLVAPLPDWFRSRIPHVFDFKGKLKLREVDGQLLTPNYPFWRDD